MPGVGIQVSLKIGSHLVNIQGDDPTEFDMNLSHVVDKAGDIRAAEAALKGTDGVTLLQEGLGAVPLGEVDGPPWEPPPSTPAAPAYQQTHCGRCKIAPTCKTCNRPTAVIPRSVKNGQWYIHDCPSGEKDHKGSWCNEPK